MCPPGSELVAHWSRLVRVPRFAPDPSCSHPAHDRRTHTGTERHQMTQDDTENAGPCVAGIVGSGRRRRIDPNHCTCAALELRARRPVGRLVCPVVACDREEMYVDQLSVQEEDVAQYAFASHASLLSNSA